MEIRTLTYFLAVVREGSISNAAKRLHVTQTTLSRQMAALEDELGRQLYTRGQKGIELTEQGVILQRYAESIIELVERAEEEISLPAKTVSGTVHIGVGETKAVGLLAEAMEQVRVDYPGIDFALYSGNSADLMDNFNRGFYDLLMECEVKPHVNLNVLRLPGSDVWGILARRDSVLGQLDRVRPEDIDGHPFITSLQGHRAGKVDDWIGPDRELNVVATYNLPHNTKFLVRKGLGYVFTYEGIFDATQDSDLVFVPLEPRLESYHGILWRKTLPTKQTQVFLDKLTQLCAERG